MGKLLNRENDNRDIMLLCIFLLIQFMNLWHKGLNPYIVFQYLLCWQYGFMGRGLIGTLIYPLGYLSAIKLHVIFMAGTIILTVSYVLFFRYILKGFSGEKRDIVRAVLWTTAFMPQSICMYYLDWGRFDIYLLTLSFLIAWIVLEKKSLYLIIPICLLEVMIYPGVVFMHFLIAEALLLYLAASNVKNARTVFWINSITTGCLFLYFVLVNPSLNLSVEEMKLSMLSRTSVDISPRIPLIDLWFGSNQDNIAFAYALRGNGLELLFYFVMISPILLFIGKFFVRYFKGKGSLYTILLAVLPLGHIPYLLLETDYGRLYGAFLWSAFILFLAILKTEDAAFEVISGLCLEYKLRNRIWLLYIYLLLLGTSYEQSIVNISTKLSKLVRPVLAHIL